MNWDESLLNGINADPVSDNGDRKNWNSYEWPLYLTLTVRRATRWLAASRRGQESLGGSQMSPVMSLLPWKEIQYVHH